ncbi:MAG: DUF2125 domain-containing protein [Pseudoruegeria sp.]
MKRNLMTGAAISALTVFSANVALADLTAEQVWAQWQDVMNASGYEVNVGNADLNGGTLTLTDIGVSMMLEPEGSMIVSLPEVTFQENGDGTVNVIVPPSYPMNMNVFEDDETVDISMTVSQDGLSLTVSGDENDSTYDYEAAQVALSVDEVKIEEETLSNLGVMSLSGLKGTYSLTSGDTFGYSTSATADGLSVEIDITAPEETLVLKATASATDLKSTTDATLPMGIDPQDTAAYMAEGFAVDATGSYGAITFNVTGDDDGSTFATNGKATNGTFNFNVSENGMGYGGSMMDIIMAVSGSDIPLPSIDVTMGEYVFNLLMPIAKSDEPEDFALTTKIVDLGVSDMIWGLVDPVGALPHDPATLIVELAGKGNWNFDIMNVDPENPETLPMGEMPGEVHSLELKELQLKAAGADLTGTGAFTFDNSDLTTFPGMPRPEGQIDLQLLGANGLIDTLVDMGMLPQEQAMGARMMMGLFARPGEGDDSLVSTIEVNEEGAVLANGQRLR